MSEIRIDVDVTKVTDRLGRVLPEAIRAKAEGAFRRIVGRLEYLVLQNIENMFAQEGRSKGRLEESIVATVTREGDLLVGEVKADLTHAPYARILELGGVIRAHTISPRRAGGLLTIPVSTLKGFEEIEGTAPGDFLFATQAFHPGAKITAHYYMRGALARLSQELEDDMQKAVGEAVLASER